MSESTGWWVWMDRPQLPVRMPPKYVPIRTGSGWFRPRYCLARTSCAAEACGPAHATAGSPGTRPAITNVRITTPATTTIARATRRMAYRVTRRSCGASDQGFRLYANTTFGYAGLTWKPEMPLSIAYW